MKISTKIIIIFTVLFLELVWGAWPRLVLHGKIYDEAYRHDERIEALTESREHPSPETKAAFDTEVALLDRHLALQGTCIFAGVLVINAIGIYFFWRYAPTKRTT